MLINKQQQQKKFKTFVDIKLYYAIYQSMFKSTYPVYLRVYSTRSAKLENNHGFYSLMKIE